MPRKKATDQAPSINETSLYVPSLGKAFRPGGWDFAKSEPTGAAGSEYEPGEWDAEQTAAREAARAEAEEERTTEQSTDDAGAGDPPQSEE